jgi:uncharacterized protein (TIGR02597 family)
LPSQPDTYYVQFKTGSAAGRFYTVTANGSASLTIDWNGETAAAAAGDQFELIPYWTMISLFPASDAGVSFTETTNTSSYNTELRTVDDTYVGINPPVGARYYFYNGAWRKDGQSTSTSYDDTVLTPDAFYRVRNGTSASTLTVLGAVTTGRLAILINAQGGTTKQDNAVSLRFAGTVTLADSNLIGSGAFSISTSAAVRKDELRVYDNTIIGYDKVPSAIYFYYNGGWRKAGVAITIDFGTTQVFTPGAAVLIRKAGTGGSAQTSYWTYDVTGL